MGAFPAWTGASLKLGVGGGLPWSQIFPCSCFALRWESSGKESTKPVTLKFKWIVVTSRWSNAAHFLASLLWAAYGDESYHQQSKEPTTEAVFFICYLIEKNVTMTRTTCHGLEVISDIPTLNTTMSVVVFVSLTNGFLKKELDSWVKVSHLIFFLLISIDL